jgi:anaerobic ribonucleoside-triphosphate reductase activating protein
MPIIEGVTFSGGEPFEQAKALNILVGRLKRINLNILCYSGYTYAELQCHPDPSVMELLANTDILIDGPYVEELREVAMWKGSSNQQLHIFTPTLKNCVRESFEEIEIIISEEGKIDLTGSFHKERMDDLIQD